MSDISQTKSRWWRSLFDDINGCVLFIFDFIASKIIWVLPFTLSVWCFPKYLIHKRLHLCESESRSVVSDSLRLHGLYGPWPYSILYDCILQARIPEWVVVSFCRGSSQPRDHTQVSWHAGRLFTIWTTREFSIKLSQCYTLSIKWQQHQTLLSRAYAISYVEQCCDMLTLTSLHWNSVSDKQTQLWSDK